MRACVRACAYEYVYIFAIRVTYRQGRLAVSFVSRECTKRLFDFSLMFSTDTAGLILFRYTVANLFIVTLNRESTHRAVLSLYVQRDENTFVPDQSVTNKAQGLT